MPSTPAAITTAPELVNPSELMTVAVFARTFPNIVPSEGSLRWYIRHRHLNGLAECGAVLELRSRPEHRRHRILIAPTIFLAWAQGRFGRGR